MLKPCIEVEGVIEAVRHEPDGDDHIRLRVSDAALVNPKNVSEQHGDLVLEPVCEHAVTQADAVTACAGYRSDVRVPPVGTRVRAVGPWVLDTAHGWLELHPVISMEVIK